MKISWNWLKTLVDVSDFEPARVSEILTARGLEVEGMTPGAATLDGVMVAKILEITPHPSSDHLHLVAVDLGDRVAHVVCGAPGLRVGWLVPYASVGARVGDLVIRAAEVRGELSDGMLCSEQELGLGSDHETLLCLPEGARLGAPLTEVLGLCVPDGVAQWHGAVLEIGLTPDRGDCLSHWGVARELGAATERACCEPKGEDLSKFPEEKFIQIEDGADCGRYFGALIEGIAVGPSPAWLRRAVEACGARSINNVVDVTNFVCFELGHPLHAFDLDKLTEPKLTVRRARAGESIVAINHETYALCEDDIVIADERPVAIAGVMGGAETEVSEGTGRILLEVAAFSPTQVRKTAKRLGLHSESSHRFERFVDAEGITRAVSRAIWLLGQAQNAPIRVTAVHDCRAVSHVARKLTLRSARVSDVLGVTLNAEVLSRILQPIGFVADDWSLPQIELTVPSWRSDVTREIDIIEEICRGYGVDNLTAAMPEVALEAVHVLRPVAVNPTAYPVVPTIWDRKDRKNFHDLREALMAAGLHECMHYTFMDPSDPKRLCFPSDVRESKPIRLTNPMSAEQSAMRTTLLPGMLKALKTNVAQQQKHCALFELGDVFFTVQQGNLTVAESVPHLCVMMWGEPEKAWFAAPRAYDVYDVKGVLASAFGELGYHMQCEQVDKAVSWLHDGVQARIVFEGRTIGYFGELHPVAAKRHKLDGPVFLAHIDISSLLASHQPHQRVSPLARFPHSTRDQSMVVSADVTFEQIESIVESVRPETLESWRIFDVYRGKQITPGMQSISLTFRYRHPLAHDIELGQTLTDDEVNRAHEVIVTTLLSALGSQIR